MNKGIFGTIVLIVCFIIATTITVFAENTVKREGKNFTVEQTLQQSSDTQTEYTYTVKDTVYPIWITKNGRCYILRTSKKTGNEYKQYLDKEIALQICKELNITYKE